ncbi:MAG: glycosyltransferase family 39 protein [Planctomycetaceae bacterium]|nr:glycosyltransferase family 39 protein [Planctomycetaceae bacterium]
MPDFRFPIPFLFCLLFLLATSQMLPLTWDEGESIDRANKIAAWFQVERPLSRDSIREHWVFTTQIEGHPAGYGIVIAAGHAVSHSILPPKTAYRFGPMFLFAVALGAVFRKIEKNVDFRAALFAVLAILLTPRLFAHAHIAACDSTLTACWLLAWACFDLKTSRKTIIWGIFLGLTFSAKFTGWIAIVPFFLSLFFSQRHKAHKEISENSTPLCPSCLCERKKSLLHFAYGFAVALLTFFVLNPPLWWEPIHGFCQFFTLNMSRENFNISILFLGRMYNLDHPLPWYNTIVWVAITVPGGFLVLLFYGIGHGFVKRNQIVLSLILHAGSLLVVRAIPGTPPHDGVRLFVTAFAFLAILTGIGAAALTSVRLRRFRVGLYLVTLIYVTAMFNLYWYAPQWLSYYNAVVGGLPGAVRAGMEPTYYWDSLDKEVADWLAANVKPDETVLFSASSKKTLALQRQWGELRTDFYRKDAEYQKGKTIRYYVLQRRPSGEYAADQRLIKQAKPVYTKTIRHSGFGWWKLDDVPILEIYEFKDYLKARQVF